MIDSHCHLAHEQFSDDVAGVVDRAVAAGVTHMMTIGDSLSESKKCVELAERFSSLFCTVGMHPHGAKEWTEESEEMLRTMVSSSDRVRGIGEIGLDYHYDFSPRDVQRLVFEAQLCLAKELDLPAVVHCREAVEDVWSIVSAVNPSKLVLHCCTEKYEDVERFLHAGYLLSFTGIATYPNGNVVRETIKRTSLTQMMIETDAPFLAPVPHRGKRNEPAFVVDVAKKVAEIKDISLQEIDEQTTKNAVEFFGLPL